MVTENPSQGTHVAHIIIACFAFGGNAMVCLLFSKNKVLLKKSYNVFLLLLAMTDLLMAIVLLVSSAFRLSDMLPKQDSVLASKIFCHVVWSGWLLFTLSDASVYICLVLTYKRWCAVVQPLAFTSNFHRRRFVVISLVICLLATFSTLPRFFEVDYDASRPNYCSWKVNSTTKHQSLAAIQLTLNIIFPSGVMTGIYCNMLYKTRLQKHRVLPNDRALQRRKGRRKMVRVALVVMFFCWMPYQLLYFLSMVDVTQVDSTTHHWTTILVFVTACINPFIYGVTNHTYRRGYFEIALGCCPVKVHGFLSRHLPMSQMHHAAILVSSIHGRRPVSAPQTFRQTAMLELNP